MRFLDYALWNPFALFKPHAREPDARPTSTTNIKEKATMANPSEFEIPSAILACALVEKSELTGAELEAYAISVQRKLVRHMMLAREKMETEQNV